MVNFREPKGQERYSHLINNMYKNKVTMEWIRKGHEYKDGKVKYSAQELMTLRDMVLTNNLYQSPTYLPTEFMIRNIYDADILIGDDNTLHIVPYTIVVKTLEFLSTHLDELDLPEKEKKDFLVFAEEVEEKAEKAIIVDYFYVGEKDNPWVTNGYFDIFKCSDLEKDLCNLHYFGEYDWKNDPEGRFKVYGY